MFLKATANQIHLDHKVMLATPRRTGLGLRITMFAMVLFLTLPAAGQNMNGVIASVRKKFPSVRQLSTEELANWIADTNRAMPLLVDAREAAEFSVSHLQK